MAAIWLVRVGSLAEDVIVGEIVLDIYVDTTESEKDVNVVLDCVMVDIGIELVNVVSVNPLLLLLLPPPPPPPAPVESDWVSEVYVLDVVDAGEVVADSVPEGMKVEPPDVVHQCRFEVSVQVPVWRG